LQRNELIDRLVLGWLAAFEKMKKWDLLVHFFVCWKQCSPTRMQFLLLFLLFASSWIGAKENRACVVRCLIITVTTYGNDDESKLREGMARLSLVSKK